jgi:N-formylglutamate amidohydrolase
MPSTRADYLRPLSREWIEIELTQLKKHLKTCLKCYIKAMTETETSAKLYQTPFSIARPKAERASPIVVTSPHSGCDYPAAFLAASRLSAHDLRQSEDMYVDALFSEAANFGATLISARYPRSFVDLNRSANEIDPNLVEDDLPIHREQSLPRVQAGLGTIPRIVAEDTPIYDDKLSIVDIAQRMREIYHPFHATLEREVTSLHNSFGAALLVDAHSMPSLATRNSAPRNRSAQIDIVLGNCHGRACSERVTDFVNQYFRRSGYTIALNRPYAGGYITSHFGRPHTASHAIQIEINRALYMNEASYEMTANFDSLKADLSGLVAALTAAWRDIMPVSDTADTKAAE